MEVFFSKIFLVPLLRFPYWWEKWEGEAVKRGFLAQVALELDQKEGRRDTPKGLAHAGV